MKKHAIAAVVVTTTMTVGMGSAGAHINLSWPPARYELGTAAQKIGPCGGGNATGVVTELAPGEPLTVTWTETVNHPGHFRVALDPTGTDDCTDPVTENDMDITGNVVAYVPDDGGSSFQHTFTLPDVACDGCVLQVLQVMTDKLGNGYGGYPDNDDLYYWCADIAIKPTAGSTSSSSGSAGGTNGTGGTDGATGPGGSASDGSSSDDVGGCVVSGVTPGASDWGHGALVALALGALLRRRRLG